MKKVFYVAEQKNILKRETETSMANMNPMRSEERRVGKECYS